MDVDEVRARRRSAVRKCSRVLMDGSERTLGDWVERLSADVRSAGVDLEAPVDLYDDGVVEELEDRVAVLLGTEAAAFFPTGTMAQQVALRAWAGRTGSRTVALHPLAHPVVHERDALHTVSGLRTVHPTAARRLPTAEEVRDFEEPFGTLMLELPLRDAGFVLPTWDELERTVAAARDRDAVVHFDGARLWESAPHFGRTLPQIADLADSVYVSFYKALGGLSGAALAASADFVAEARAWRQRCGGMLYHQFPVALSALAGLAEVLPKLPAYVAHARVVAAALREGLAGAGLTLPRVYPEPPHTHQFQLWLPYPAKALNLAATRQAEETGVSLFGTRSFAEPALPGMSMVEVTVARPALEWTGQDVRAAAAVFAGCLD